MARFQPVRPDGRARWRVIYEYIAAEMKSGRLTIGSIIKHDELLGAADLDAASPVYYQAVDRAAWELKAEDKRSLLAIRGVGYQLIVGEAMVDESRRRQRKGQRNISKALVTARSVDRVDLPRGYPIDQIITGLVAIANIAKMTAEKVEEHEREIAALRSAQLVDRAKSTATDEQVAAMRKQLSELERRLDEREGQG